MYENRCRNCLAEPSDKTETALTFQGDWYCSAFCAEACAGFWSQGYDESNFGDADE